MVVNLRDLGNLEIRLRPIESRVKHQTIAGGIVALQNHPSATPIEQDDNAMLWCVLSCLTKVNAVSCESSRIGRDNRVPKPYLATMGFALAYKF